MMVCYLRCTEGTFYLLKCFKYSERILLCLMLSVCEVDPMLQREVTCYLAVLINIQMLLKLI